MNKKLLAKFEKLLLQEKQQIAAHLEERKEESEKEIDDSPGDQVDIASSEINQAAMQKLGSRERNLLKKIDKALAKIKSGDYGDCEECGEEISPARLEARPVALLCIDCKTTQEQKERQYMEESDEEDGGFGGDSSSEDFSEG